MKPLMTAVWFASILMGFAAATRAAEPPVADAELKSLLDRAGQVIEKVHGRELRSDKNTPWVIMHAVIAFEQNLDVIDAEKNQKVNAIEYLLTRATHEGRAIFRDIDGVPTLPPRKEYFQVQDHVDQHLMAYADAGVGLDRSLIADSGKRYTIGDVLDAAKRGFKPDQELGWTLVATTTYMKFSETWMTADGQTRRIDDIMALAIRRDPRHETEGGPHHLYGVAYALQRYRRQHPGELTGVWAEARKYLDQYIDLAKRYQQEDGALSGMVFRRAAPPRTPRDMVSTTGHFLEWMSVAMDRQRLTEPWVLKAVGRLCDEMLDKPLDLFSDGGMYHAAHALRRWRDAVSE